MSTVAPRSADLPATVLHYLGYDEDRGGIVSVVRGLAAERRFGCVLGVNPGFTQARTPPLPVLELPPLAGEQIGLAQLWRARATARSVAAWLAGDPARVFHGHSRSGLLVGGWLHAYGETRAVVSVHCYGRQRWFYRRAARRLGDRLFWLSPAMRGYYGVVGTGWEQCIPGGVAERAARPPRIPDGYLRLAGVGMLVRWKGWHLVLEALAALPAAERARVIFEHIGGPIGEADSLAYAEELRRRTAELGLSETVRWCGPEPSSERVLAVSDVLVVASENEPFSVAMLEALAAGVPVLAAASGGALDVVRPSENGWFFRCGDAADLAARMRDLAGSDAVRKLAVEPIRASAIRSAAVAAQWAEVYAGLVASSASSAARNAAR